MDPKFTTLNSVKLAGYMLKTNSNGENIKEIPAFWTAYLTDGRAGRLHQADFIKSHDEYGACFPEDPENGEFIYVIGVEVKDGVTIPKGFYVCELPAATYAVFSTPPCRKEEFSKNIQGTWQYIMNDWFPSSGYEYAAGRVDFEYYDKRCTEENNNVCDIYIPVVKR